MHKYKSPDITIGVIPRTVNCGIEPLHIVEIQGGDYLVDDDIQPDEDSYGR